MKTIKINPNSVCWTSSCAILLLHIQNAAYRICPPFYYERRVSHNDRLLSILSETKEEKERSISLIVKELFIYRSFAQQNLQTVIEWNKTATAAETLFLSISAIDADLLNQIAEPLLRFASYPETTDYVSIYNALLISRELQLFELFKHISIQVNYLKD